MSPGVAYAVWISGEILFAAAGIFAAIVIGCDIRRAWPIIKHMWSTRHDDEI